MSRDIEYEQNNIEYNWQNCGIQCKNYKVCKEVLPNWWYSCKKCYLCTNCDIAYGTELTFLDCGECIICFNSSELVKELNCNHSRCIDCFIRCHYGEYEPEPPFPYPEIENEYFEDTDEEKWLIDYPLIAKYREDDARWEQNKWIKYEAEQHLRLCPLCRM